MEIIISSIVIGWKKSFFSTNSVANLLSDSTMSQTYTSTVVV